MARATREGVVDPRDQENAQKQLDVLHQSIKSILDRIYTITSHSFHVLLRDLIPHARQDSSNLFTHIKGARTDHIIALRAHHSKKRDEGLPPLNPDELKPHSAQHTLQFIEDEYVEKDDDASHYTWGDILTATVWHQTPPASGHVADWWRPKTCQNAFFEICQHFLKIFSCFLGVSSYNVAGMIFV
jgi:hypothetical protein